jgi:hypothetical protein
MGTVISAPILYVTRVVDALELAATPRMDGRRKRCSVKFSRTDVKNGSLESSNIPGILSGDGGDRGTAEGKGIFKLTYSLFETAVRQEGQVFFLCIHGPKQSRWKACTHVSVFTTFASAPSISKQILHSIMVLGRMTVRYSTYMFGVVYSL